MNKNKCPDCENETKLCKEHQGNAGRIPTEGYDQCIGLYIVHE